MTEESRIRELEGRGHLRCGAEVYRTSNLTVTTGTSTPLTWQAAVHDDFGFWSNASATNRLKIPVGGGGLYLAEIQLIWDTGAVVTSAESGLRVYNTSGSVVASRSCRGSIPRSAASALSAPEFFVVEVNELEEIDYWVLHQSGADRLVMAYSDTLTSNLPRFKFWRFCR